RPGIRQARLGRRARRDRGRGVHEDLRRGDAPPFRTVTAAGSRSGHRWTGNTPDGVITERRSTDDQPLFVYWRAPAAGAGCTIYIHGAGGLTWRSRVGWQAVYRRLMLSCPITAARCMPS